MDIRELLVLEVFRRLAPKGTTCHIEAFGSDGNKCRVTNRFGKSELYSVRLVSERYERHDQATADQVTVDELKSSGLWIYAPPVTNSVTELPAPPPVVSTPITAAARREVVQFISDLVPNATVFEEKLGEVSVITVISNRGTVSLNLETVVRRYAHSSLTEANAVTITELQEGEVLPPPVTE